MAHTLECDTCDFERTIDDEVDAHAAAKEHESEYPDHFVVMEWPAE